MDAAFIQQNQIIERYLMGKLPLKGAQDFERWCRENPEVIAQLGFADRINAALRLMDASGEPLPWTEKPLAPWQKPATIGAIAAVALAATITAVMLFMSGSAKDAEIGGLQRQLKDQPLSPVQSTRNVTVAVSRSGPVTRGGAVIGQGRTELADLRFDVAWSSYSNFIITIDREGQGRVGVFNNIARDSNGQLRVALNSSLLGPGEYEVKIDGLNPRRGTEPQAWARFAVGR